jgi:septin family protein
VPPFAVVSSRQYDSSVGRYWPVRRYPWGVCEALSSEHSDVAALKKLLLELCFEEFKVRPGNSLEGLRRSSFGTFGMTALPALLD